MPLFWDLVHLSTEIPLQLQVSTTLLKQSHNHMIHKTSLWRWQRDLLLLKDHQQGPSTSPSRAFLRNGAEKIWWISPLCETSLRLFHVPVPSCKQAPVDH